MTFGSLKARLKDHKSNDDIDDDIWVPKSPPKRPLKSVKSIWDLGCGNENQMGYSMRK